ncbi:formyl-CoA transferase [Photorhabdus sp. HUG-39]|uniref:CoA transferase n=2 Tax=Morganellaceae TaxID=1903414 RepID=A0ABX0B461_9GAMM|nr:CoA transferase [Photorhabdus kayaii]NDL27938.1 CoA transferase [Photorhabdus kayaii]RAX06430.1 formyl-CoA transferase [Photorhabdus sp. HUG-39]
MRCGMTALPLSGIVVVDLTRHRAGPVTSRLLGDWGAEIIKIEEPTDKGDSMGGTREGFDYQDLHRNKKSLSVNLKTKQGQGILQRLVRKADIVLENFRPEVKFRLGVDYESLKKINPRIICGSISGFGQNGPYSSRPAVDQIVQGMSGLMSVTGTQESGALRTGVAIADISSGMNLAQAVLLALYHREKTGEGQWVYTSLLESTLAIMDFQVARWLADGKTPELMGNDHPTLMPTGVVRTKDSEINIAAAEDEKFQKLCHLLDIEAVYLNPQYSDIYNRSKNRKQLMDEIQAVTRKFESKQLIQILNDNGIPSGYIYDIAQAMSDPQIQYLKMKCSIKHPLLGDLTLVGQPIHLSAFSDFDTVRNPAPEHGQHTENLLKNFLGFDNDEIASFRKIEVI